MEIGEVNKAKEIFLETNDNYGLGLVALENRDIKDALVSFSSTNDYSGIGLTNLAVKDYKTAEENFIKHNDFDGLGSLYAEKGDLVKALEYYKQSGNLNAEGDIYYKLESYDEAFKNFDEGNFYSKAASALKENNKFDEAINYINEKLTNNKDDYELYKILGEIYLEKGESETAENFFQKMKESALYAPMSLYLMAKAKIKSGDYDRAIEYISQLKINYGNSSYAIKADNFVTIIEQLQNIK